MKRRSITGRRLVLLLLLALTATTLHAEKLTLERLFAAPDLSGASLRSPKISPDGRLVAYLRAKSSDTGQLDLWAYDVAARKNRLLVDSTRLVPQEQALSAEEAQRRERQRIAAFSGIVEYEFSPDSRRLLVPLGGDLYVYDLQAAPAKAVRRITETPGYETDAQFSEGGRYVSFVRDQNLVAYDLDSGREAALTTDGAGLVSYGTAEFVAQEEMGRRTGYWWSPDDRRIAFTRVDDSPVAEVERFEILADGVRTVKQRYPATGTRNARVQLFVATLGEDRDAPVEVDLGADPDFYLARVDWFPDGKRLAVQRQSRDQKTLTLLAADPGTGATTQILKEEGNAWVDLSDDLTFLEKSPQFIWPSSRTGFRHLYLYENDGRLVRALTSGEWGVVPAGFGRAVQGVDEGRGLVYFTANADTPLERHLYSVPLRGPAAAPRRLTQGSGWHAVTMSKNARVFLDSFSTPERPPAVTVRAASGAALGTLVANELNADHPYTRYLDEQVPAEFGTLKASDGQTLYYQMLKPRDLVPGRRYPVIVDVYGGPGSQDVRRAWGNSARSNDGFFHQYLAQQGYVVFNLDNRGTGSRGVKFETALYRRFGSVEVEDQVAGAEFLKSLPFVDPKRIGIFGWSYGGYMALMCATQAPETFAAAVAGAPVTNWYLYDTHYTERYMGTPQENADGYAWSDVRTHAEGLRAPLLVMHGMADDNVLFTNSTALFKKLQDLGKPFEVMVYPGSKHGLLRDPRTGLHAYRMVKQFFDDKLGAAAPGAGS
jgi:dipeptidyl-peptidase-4